MATLGALIVDIVANTTALKQGLDQARSETKRFQSDVDQAIKRTQQSLGVDRVAAGMSVVGKGTAAWQEGLRRLSDQARDAGRGVNQFGGNVAELGDAIGDTLRQLGLFHGGLGGLGPVLTGTAGKIGGIVAAVGAATVALVKLTEVGAVEQRQQLRLASVIRATGGAAGFSAEQIRQMADEMEGRTLFDDRSIRQAATQLATFGNVSGQVFRDALRLGVDLAEVFELDVTTAVMAMGKALDSPKEGVTALSRLIGRISPELQAQIGSLVDQNRLLDAQLLIVKEIEGRVGGAGTGAASGLAGGWHRVKDEIDDAKKSLGLFMVEYIEWFGKIGKFANPTDWETKDASELTRGPKPGVPREVVTTGGITPFDQAGRLRDMVAAGAAQSSEVKRLREIRKEYADALKQLNATTASTLGMTEDELRARRLAIGRELKAINDLFDQQGPGKSMLAELDRQHDQIAEFFSSFDLKGAQAIRDEWRSQEIRVEEALRDLDLAGRDTVASDVAQQMPLKPVRRPEGPTLMEMDEQDRLVAQAEEQARLYEQTWKNAVRGVQGAFTDLFSGLFEEGNNLVDFFKNVADAIKEAFANLLSQQIIGQLGPLLGLGGGGGKKQQGGGFGFDDVIGIGAGIVAPVLHTGGVVGEGGPSRQVSEAAFVGAPRFHRGGVAGDEVPAILQRGETVLPRGMSPVIQGGDQFNIAVNLNAQALDARGVDQVLLSHYPAITAAAMRGISQSRAAQRFLRGG